MKTITKIFIITGAMLSLFKASAQTVLSADVKGLSNKEVTFYYLDGSTQKSDKVKPVDGKFSWTAPINKVQRVTLMFPNRAILFYAERGSIKISGSFDALDNLLITGTPTQNEFNAYNAALKAYIEKDTTGNNAAIPNVVSENYARDRIRRAKKRVFDDQYIEQHPKSIISLYALIDRAIIGSYDEVITGYEKLGASLKALDEGKELGKRVQILKRKRVGQQVFDFTLNDINGNPVSISKFKGQYVLIDFWASWCSPCRAENPNIVKAYNAYKAQKFNVIGITIDENLDKWRQAVKEDGTPWTQLADIKNSPQSVSEYYGIRGVPSSLLLDPTGKIIAIDVRGESLKKKLTELFAGPGKI